MRLEPDESARRPAASLDSRSRAAEARAGDGEVARKSSELAASASVGGCGVPE